MTSLGDIEELDIPPQPLITAAIMRYTGPGELIVDLGCGDGRALVAAIRADRLAIGVERSRRLAGEARKAVVEATGQGGPGFAAVVVGELADVPKLVGPDSLGKASLALIDMTRVGVLGEHARVDTVEAVERLATALGVCRALLRPGGHVFVSAQCDLSDQIGSTASATPVFHIVGKRRDVPGPRAAHRQVSAVVLRYASAQAGEG